MKIVVFGATGRTGKYLVQQAVDQAYEVTAFARNPQSLPKHLGLRVVSGDVLAYDAVKKAIDGQDAVLCVLGPNSRKAGTMQSQGTLHIVRAMKETHVSRLIVQTSVEVGDSRGQGGILFGRFIRPLFLREIFEDKELQEKVTRESNLQWTLVRPTGLTDERALGLNQVRVSIDGEKVPLRIARADVACFILEELRSSRYLYRAPTIGTHRGLLGF
jgi:putative NADH-flavin reductase